MNEERLVELEIKYAHQDLALEELQKVTYEQHLAIERLTKELKLLRERFEGTVEGPEIGPANQKPPHY